MRNNSIKYFEFRTVFQEEMFFKDISYLDLRQPLFFDGVESFVQYW